MTQELEHPCLFECEGEQLVGIYHGVQDAANCAVLLVVGGPQYRIGSHRQFVLLARALAAAGIPCLRFDVRGMGDSSGEMRSFETLDADIAAGRQALAHHSGTEHIVLWGLCDAASAIAMYLDKADAGPPAAVILLNPWVHTEAGEAAARVKHYYLQRLFSADLWRKITNGEFKLLASVRDLFSNVRKMRDNSEASAAGSYIDRMRVGLERYTAESASRVRIVKRGRLNGIGI